MLQRNYNKHVEKWGAEWLRVGSTLTLKPDLDNANVGKPDSRRLLKCRLYWSYQIGNSFFVQIKDFGGKGYGNSERKRSRRCRAESGGIS